MGSKRDIEAMTESEAIEEVRVLADLFPKVGDTQLDFWLLIFMKYEQAIVRKSVMEYTQDDRTGFIDRTKLRAIIENLSGEKTQGERDRIDATIRESQERQQRKEHDVRAQSESFSSIDFALRDLDDAELAELKAAVLADSKPELADVLRLSDPKSGKALRVFMARKLQAAN